MPFTKFTNLDFDQIKTSIKDYLRTNSDFTDFDFEGSNFSVLIDTLAYNTYITAFNSNMVVNESFLDSATVRENVVSLARNIGYVPRSKSAAKATISFNIDSNDTTEVSTVTLKAGLVCIGSSNDITYTFSIPDDITTTVTPQFDAGGSRTGYTASFNSIEVFQGTLIRKSFTVDGSLDQRFILENPSIDTSTIIVYVKDDPSGADKGILFTQVDNILNIDSNSPTFLIQEIQDEKYELLFGDGIFGRKIENGKTINVSYLVTDGREGNGPAFFSYAGNIENDSGSSSTLTSTPTISVVSAASNGGDIESVDSIKYFAPRLYSSQYRAVTARDYEAIIQQIYPNTESVSVVGGEEIDPPQFGTVFITIKPKNGDFVSDFDKTQILSDLKNYSLTGINQKIVDLKVLHIELESFIYYDSSRVKSVNELKTRVTNGLTTYSRSTDVNKFGGRFKYSKILSVIDNIEDSITSNITRIRIRRNLNALLNQFAQYEICFGNQFNVKSEGLNIKSTGFKISGVSETVFLTDTPNADKQTGIVSIVKRDIVDGQKIIIVENAGTVDYIKGEINLTTINITSTDKSNNIIEIQAFPESNDVIGLEDLYLKFNIESSSINMVKDTISSGDQISGVGYKVTSSYTNGDLIRG
ncbi:MAG: hypothetical protein CM15mL5_1860 [uncultured marine virus]|nr:MAG: hypothetical protein CM15mL5_1860 [uncultured marine virus]